MVKLGLPHLGLPNMSKSTSSAFDSQLKRDLSARQGTMKLSKQLKSDIRVNVQKKKRNNSQRDTKKIT